MSEIIGMLLLPVGGVVVGAFLYFVAPYFEHGNKRDGTRTKGQ